MYICNKESYKGNYFKMVKKVDVELASCGFTEQDKFIDVFTKIVQMYPDKIAARDESSYVSYAELNSISDSIAYYVSKEMENNKIAVCMDRSVMYLATIIAIFKVGGIYIPIDPNAPNDRKLQMIEDADVKIFITNKEYCEKLKEIDCVKKLCIENFQKPQKFNLNQYCENEAYIIFTSGTTGKPKGAIVNHIGMMNHLRNKIEILNISKDTILLETAPQSFDISVWQFLSVLLVGGEVHIIKSDNAKDISFLLNYIKNNKINIVEFVPTLFTELLQEIKDNPILHENLSLLRFILLTGESLPVSLCCNWYSMNYDGILVNAYGPTECSDDITHYLVPKTISNNEKKVPIGKGIKNANLYVVREIDSNNEVIFAEEGERGELYVSGICLGNGYINNPEKTADAFKEVKIHGITTKVYKTGDLVSYENGNYIFWERVDRQIKLNGYRIELEEIEEVIRGYDKVNNCCVVKHTFKSDFVYYLHNDQNDRKTKQQEKLVAYIVSDDIDFIKLKEWLKTKLPYYMVPEQFVSIDQIPVSANGKVDQKKLPEPKLVREVECKTYEAPCNEVEKKIAEIWSNILNVSPISRNDSFFELGGNSITAIQTISRIRKELNVVISFSDFYSSKDLIELCSYVYKSVATDNQNIITASNKENYFAASYGQCGQWFLWKLSKNVPFYTFQGLLNIFGNANYEKINKTINYLICNNDVLRTRFVEVDYEVKQFIEPYSFSNYEYIDLSKLDFKSAESEMKDVAYKDAQQAFDIENDSVIRIKIFKLSENQITVVITMHEIIMDAWAMRQFIKEFIEVYRQIDLISIEKKKVLQFHDYAEWQRKNITRVKLEKEGKFWKENLSGELPVLDVSYDFPRPQIPTYKGRSQGITFDVDLSKRIKDFCKNNNITLFVFLLSAYYVLLSKYSNQDEVMIGTPYGCRNSEQTENLYGDFLNMLPLRFNINGTDTLDDLIHKTKSIVNSAIDNSRYPFPWIVEDLGIKRNTSYTPVFQVMFDMINFPKIDFPVDSSITVNFEEIDIGYKKYDLAMYGNEQDGKVFVKLSYLTDLFKDETITNYLKSYELIVMKILDAGKDLIKDTNVIDEKYYFYIKDLDRREESFKIQCENDLLKWIEHDLESNKEKIAYKTLDSSISFGELYASIKNVSKEFVKYGINSKDRVIIYGKKDIDYLILLYSFYQNKVAYLPCDITRPKDSINEIVDDISINYIFSTESLIDEQYEQIGKYNNYFVYKTNKAKESNENIACIILTSGSSGKEKYVEIRRDSVYNRIFAQIEDYPLKHDDIIGSLRPFTLVTHLFEFFVGLYTKVTTVMLDKLEVLNESVLINTLKQNNVSYITLSPSLLRVIIHALDRENVSLNSLRMVFSGSDKLDKDLVKTFYEYFPTATLYNTYGTTETSSTILIQQINKEGLVAEEKVIKGCCIKVLNENLQEQPFGVEGNVAVFGKCVSNGYIGNRFTTKLNNEKCYFPGDVAFINGDGKFTFIGRKDRTIKCRGYRINMAEIESELKQCKNIDAVACVYYENDNTYEYSVLYTSHDEDKSKDLREILEKKYPNYMLPVSFIRVDSIPKTGNGKIKFNELKAIYDMSSSQQKTTTKCDIPEMTEMEKTIRGIFEIVLKKDDFSNSDNFFTIGGHSLSAVMLCAEISDELDYDLEISDLYGGIASVQEVAKLIEEKI